MTMVHPAADRSRAHADLCASLIRERKGDILACWEERVKVLPSTRKLEIAELLDHVPEVLERIAESVDELGSQHLSPPRAETAQLHALERFEQNFDLAAVVTELGMLRSCILHAIEAIDQPVSVAALRMLDEAIDAMVTDAIDKYMGIRDETLHVFDQIATAALDSRSLEELVQRLLQILVRSSASVDLASLIGREGTAMRVRAAVGEAAAKDPAVLHLGEHIAGRVAKSRQPFELRDAANASVLAEAALPRSPLRALYAIPLIDEGDVVGVLQMGSMSVDEFSQEEKRLLRAVGARATAAINQHMLREAAERSTHELCRREEEFHALADNIPQFAWMADARGNPYWFNQRWLDYAGTTLEEMRAAGPMRFLHPDHAQRANDSYQQAVVAGRAWEAMFPLLGRSGRYRWFLCRAIPLQGVRGSIVRWFGTHTDVTEQRFLDEATKVLNSSLNYAETLQQIASLAVPDLADWCVVDLLEDQEMRRVAIANTHPEGLRLAQEWNRTYPPVLDAETGVARAIRTGEPVLVSKITDQHLAEAARNADDLRQLRELHLVSYIIAPLLARGRALGAITLVTAESNRSYTQNDCEVAKELARRAGTAVDNARLYKESQQALSQREDAVHSREEVLAIVSHDLRGPLSTIGLNAELLEQTYPAPDSTKRLEAIHRSAARMEHMIDDLLDVATIEAKGLSLHYAIEDAERIVTTVIEAHEAAAAGKGITLTQDCALASVRLSCDRERIERVFTNLIGNSLKFCTSGAAISVRGKVVHGEVAFSVEDTGPGIPAEQIPHLFDRYWTAHHARGTKGAGLGLYICKGIVEAHGGRLWVDSVVGRGTTFFFTLPLPASTTERPSRHQAHGHERT
jgi:PAS domain S-box-containing protein